MRPRILCAVVLLGTALFFHAGCGRRDELPFTAEVEEPGYRRGQELLRQGRYQEALGFFQKVIESRGLSNAPESHLQLGLLYHQHIHDPVKAIFHYRMYRELKPNNPQTELDKLVRQRIDAATRDFAATLPGPRLDSSLTPADLSDVVQSLQRENERLKSELFTARATAGAPPRGAAETASVVSRPGGETAGAMDSPVSSATDDPVVVHPSAALIAPVEEQAPLVGRPGASPTATQTQRPTPSPAPGGRRHIVKQGESIFSIARQYYGTPTLAKREEIIRANPGLNGKPDLKIGMELRIP